MPTTTVSTPRITRARAAQQTGTRWFGGAVDIDAQCAGQAPVVRERVDALGKRFVLARTVSNGNCGYNAILGTMAAQLRTLPAAQRQIAVRQLRALDPAKLSTFTFLGEREKQMAIRGQTAMLRLMTSTAHGTATRRAEVAENFCCGAQFTDAVVYLRLLSAHAQLPNSIKDRDYTDIAKYVKRNVIPLGRHASLFDLNAVATPLGLELATYNPLESGKPCIPPGGPAWLKVAIVCWAEGKIAAGHFDGLLPRKG